MMKKLTAIILLVTILASMFGCGIKISIAEPTESTESTTIATPEPTPIPTTISTNEPTPNPTSKPTTMSKPMPSVKSQWQNLIKIQESEYFYEEECQTLFSKAYTKELYMDFGGKYAEEATGYLLPGETMSFAITKDRKGYLFNAETEQSPVLIMENVDVFSNQTVYRTTSKFTVVIKEVKDGLKMSLMVRGETQSCITYGGQLGENILDIMNTGEWNEDAFEFPYIVKGTEDGFRILSFSGYHVESAQYQAEAYHDFYYSGGIYFVRDGEVYKIDHNDAGDEEQLVAEDVISFLNVDGIPVWVWSNGQNSFGNEDIQTWDYYEEGLIWSK